MVLTMEADVQTPVRPTPQNSYQLRPDRAHRSRAPRLGTQALRVFRHGTSGSEPACPTSKDSRIDLQGTNLVYPNKLPHLLSHPAASCIGGNACIVVMLNHALSKQTNKHPVPQRYQMLQMNLYPRQGSSKLLLSLLLSDPTPQACPL